MNLKSIENNAIAALSQRAAPAVLQAIKTASTKTGVNFAYLMEQAAAESSFDPDAKARTSSASGLYQFIESTWLGMVKNHGHKHGLGEYADKIGTGGKVADPETRKAILELRNDPDVAAVMAAEFASDNERYLRMNVGGDIGSTELYFAHFMGAGGATAFLKAMKSNPLQTAADLFPKAARANRNVFYDPKTGKPRTLAGVYDFFDRKFKGSNNALAAEGKTGIGADARVAALATRDKPDFRSAGARGLTDADNGMPDPAASSLWASQSAQRRQALGLLAREGLGFQEDKRTAGIMPVFGAGRAVSMSPAQIMIMARLDLPESGNRD